MRLKALALGLLALAAPMAAAAQSGGYVATLGRDTVAVESFTWTGDTLAGVSAMRSPRTMVRSYELVLAPGNALRRFHVMTGRPGAAPAQEITIDYRGDSAFVSSRRDTLTRRLALAGVAGAVPFFEDIFGPWTVLVRQARGDTVRVVAGRQLLALGVQRAGSDLRLTWLGWGTALVRTGPGGQVTGLDFTNTTSKYVVQRVGAVDVQKLAADFAAREQAGRGLGALSPRDTARAELAGAHLLVDYSRPSARGRVIWGGVVPWGQVWRTGADAATQLTTDRDLEIGGVAVPAGTYTLFSLPAQNGGWKLVINKQHGQWGTEYDAAQDLARVDLATTRLTQPVERFTFELVPGSAGGTLAFAWGDVRATTAVRVK